MPQPRPDRNCTFRSNDPAGPTGAVHAVDHGEARFDHGTFGANYSNDGASGIWALSFGWRIDEGNRVKKGNLLPWIPMFLWILPPLSHGANWVILPDGSGTAPSIQAGVDSASTGDTLLLGPGTFSGPGNRDVDLLGKEIVVLGSTGQSADCVLDCEGGGGTPHRGFFLGSGEGPETVLEGFTILNGYVHDHGGGIFCGPGTAPRIINVRLENNYASQRGGGLFCRESSLYLNRLSFKGNIAGVAGGGLFARESEITLERSELLANSVTDMGVGLGGGAAFDSLTVAELTQVRFKENAALWAGGLSSYLTTLTLTECEFSRNMAHDLCGALYVQMTGIDLFTTTLVDCSFLENTAAVAAGAISINGAYSISGVYRTRIERCLFQGNEAMFGGAMHLGGGTEMIGCRFIDNTAEVWAGAMIAQLDILTPCRITECLFARNLGGVGGGAFYGEDALITFTACTFAGNGSPGSAAGGLLAAVNSMITLENTVIAHSADGAALDADGSSGFTLSCCDLYGNPGGDWTGSVADQLGQQGNFSADPLFCDAPAGDWTLQADSPCLPGNHPDGAPCGQIGAFGEGCSGSTRTERTSWSVVKRLFR